MFNFIFFPILLIFHCIFIFLFKKFLGPVATFYSSLLIFNLCLFFNFKELTNILINGNYYYVDFGRWFFCLDLIDSHLIFCFDSLSLVCSFLVLILTSLALYFGIEYMFRDAFLNRLLYLLNLFATSVISLFFCYDFFLIIFAWECIGLFSLLLVNFYSLRIYTLKAALKTFVFSRISDMFMFLAFIFTIVIFNSTDLSIIFLYTPFLSFHYLFVGNFAFHFLTLFSFFLSLSGVIKAAQFFFHVWLPDAMEAPTPASALIHSSTLVIAGVFLILRFSLIFEFTPFTNFFLALLGGVTLAFASITAIFQTDIKKLVAYSTISQIGYLVCGCGFCCYEEVLIYLIIHALNKAFLFILVGYIVHFFNGNTDLRLMGGLFIYSFDIIIFLFTVSFNLAGLPYSAGFLGKEFLLFQFFKNDWFSFVIRSCWFIGFFFTPIYMIILTFCVSFNLKKSNYSVFLNFWNFNYLVNSIVLVKNFFYTNSIFSHFSFFQFSTVTSRTTVYVLFSFWLFFFFTGEYLLLIIFNFLNLTDTLPSHFFFLIKNHAIFDLETTNVFLHNTTFIFILFFLTLAIFFLINLKYSFNYFYLKNIFIWDFFILAVFLYLFFFFFLYALFFIIIVKIVINLKSSLFS